MVELLSYRSKKGDQYKSNTIEHFNFGYDAGNEMEQDIKRNSSTLQRPHYAQVDRASKNRNSSAPPSSPESAEYMNPGENLSNDMTFAY